MHFFSIYREEHGDDGKMDEAQHREILRLTYFAKKNNLTQESQYKDFDESLTVALARILAAPISVC